MICAEENNIKILGDDYYFLSPVCFDCKRTKHIEIHSILVTDATSLDVLNV